MQLWFEYGYYQIKDLFTFAIIGILVRFLVIYKHININK